ncbi:unnamed protein product, partial [Mesorhabditis belari]|uniref:Uncharacterized protein n=1 Tax=Mesorhabditis belari TaxID=2138241 RepID=A0AAF3EFI7_9BILA
MWLPQPALSQYTSFRNMRKRETDRKGEEKMDACEQRRSLMHHNTSFNNNNNTILAPLPEEVFSKLCNIALEKCHDKEERRRAGCGGQAMRKRVLIKNFVADLLRAQNERRRMGSISPISSDEDEWEENGDEENEEIDEVEELDQETQVDDEDIDVEEEEEEEQETTPLPPLAPPQARTFVDSDPSLSSLFPDYLDSTPDCISVNTGLSDCKLASEDRLWVYDMYGSESETAYAPHGNMEASWSPTEGWTITYDGSDDSSPTPYEQQLYVDPGSMCFSDDVLFPCSLPSGGVRSDGHDHIFLALSTNHLAEMKTYAGDMTLPEDVTSSGTSPQHSSISMTELLEPSQEENASIGMKRSAVNDQIESSPSKRLKL